MRVGVYIDGFNVYYGGRGLFGRNVAGWRWLDYRKLSERLVAQRRNWTSDGASISRIVYCTAFINPNVNGNRWVKQDAYVRGLKQNQSVDHVELGKFVERVKISPLATKGKRGQAIRTTSSWPIMVRDNAGVDVPDARFMVSHVNVEEKGSDVNLATHLMLDICNKTVDAAVVISNDADLAFPIAEMKKRVPIGVVNPSRNYLAGDLQGPGAGGHWWYQLTQDDYRTCQLPETIGAIHRPANW